MSSAPVQDAHRAAGEAPQGAVDVSPDVSRAQRPFWRQKTFWAGFGAFLFGVPGFIHDILPVLPARYAPMCQLIAVVCAALTGNFARRTAMGVEKQLDAHKEEAVDMLEPREPWGPIV